MPAKHFCPYGSNGTSVIGGNDIFEDSNITLSVAVNAIWPVSNVSSLHIVLIFVKRLSTCTQ